MINRQQIHYYPSTTTKKKWNLFQDKTNQKSYSFLIRGPNNDSKKKDFYYSILCIKRFVVILVGGQLDTRETINYSHRQHFPIFPTSYIVWWWYIWENVYNRLDRMNTYKHLHVPTNKGEIVLTSTQKTPLTYIEWTLNAKKII